MFSLTFIVCVCRFQNNFKQAVREAAAICPPPPASCPPPGSVLDLGPMYATDRRQTRIVA